MRSLRSGAQRLGGDRAQRGSIRALRAAEHIFLHDGVCAEARGGEHGATALLGMASARAKPTARAIVAKCEPRFGGRALGPAASEGPNDRHLRYAADEGQAPRD